MGWPRTCVLVAHAGTSSLSLPVSAPAFIASGVWSGLTAGSEPGPVPTPMGDTALSLVCKNQPDLGASNGTLAPGIEY
jgi:hypothetical protein